MSFGKETGLDFILGAKHIRLTKCIFAKSYHCYDPIFQVHLWYSNHHFTCSSVLIICLQIFIYSLTTIVFISLTIFLPFFIALQHDMFVWEENRCVGGNL